MAGESVALMIVGEAGIGKTRLAAAIASAAVSRGFDVAYGRCDEAVQAPFQPIVQAFGPWLAGEVGDPGDGESDEATREAAHTWPVLVERLAGGSISSTGDPEGARWRLFAAVAHLVRTRVATGPALVVIDDLQWAEPSTQLLLGHLVRSVAGGFAVVATVRPSDGSIEPSLLLGDPGTNSVVEVQRLLGLTADEVGTLVAEYVGEPSPIELTTNICRETGGNPFFVAALLAHLDDVSFVRESSGRWASHDQLVKAGVPEGVRVVVSRRLGLLPPAARRLLEVGAVYGLLFDERVVRRVCDETIGSVIDALDIAAAAGLVEEEQAGQYAFTHSLVRQGLLDELSLTRTAWLHWRIGEQLEQETNIAQRITEIAYHYAEGAGVGDLATVVRTARAAGENALCQLAFDEAATHLRRALDALDDSRPHDDVMRYDILVALGHALNALDDVEGSRPVWLDVIRTARQLRDPARLFEASRGYGYVHRTALDVDLVDLIDEVIELLDPGDSPLRTLAFAARSAPSLRHDATRSGRADLDLADQAVDMARRTGDRTSRVSTLRARLSLRSQYPDKVGMRRDAEELAALGPVGFDGFSRDGAAVLRELVRAHLRLGRRLEAESFLAQAENEAERNALPVAGVNNTLIKSALAAASGRFVDATLLTSAAIEQVGRSRTMTSLVLAAQTLAVQMEQGQVDRVIAALGQLKASPANHGWTAMLATALADTGHLDEASARLEQLVIDYAASDHNDYATSLVVRYLPELCRRLNSTDASKALMPFVEPWAGQLLVVATGVSLEGAADRSIGHLFATLGQYDEADVAYRTAAELERFADFPPLVAAHMLLACPNTDRTRRTLGPAAGHGLA